MNKERLITNLIHLVFKASGFPLEENRNRDFVIGIDREIFLTENENGFLLNIICISPKEKGYKAMADDFKNFQTAIENKFMIKRRSNFGTEYYKANVFISEPLNLECDNEHQFFQMQTQLTFEGIDYKYIEKGE